MFHRLRHRGGPADVASAERGHIEIMYDPARDGSDECLTVLFRGGGSNTVWFTLKGHPNLEEDEKLEWEEVEVSGRVFNLSDPNTQGGLSVLAFQQDGTHVQIVCDLPRSQLLDFALTFRSIET